MLNPFFWLDFIWRRSKRFLSFIFRTFLPFLFRHPSNSVFQIDLENEISCGTDIIPRVRLISSDGSSKTIVDTPTTNWTSPTSSTASERTSQTTEFPLTSVELEDIVVHYDSDDEEYDGYEIHYLRQRNIQLNNVLIIDTP